MKNNLRPINPIILAEVPFERDGFKDFQNHELILYLDLDCRKT